MNSVPTRQVRFAAVRGSLRLLAGAMLLTLLCVFASRPSAVADIVRAGAALLVY